LLRRIVGDAYPLFLLDDPTHPHIDFDGTRESLSFLAPAPMALGGSGRSRFVLSVARRGGHSDLVLTSRPELADRDASSTPVRRTLLADAQAIDFSYLGRARSARGPEWHDRWSGETVLPRLVRIRVRLASGNTRLWPELLIAPHIAVDVGCVYDPLTTQCRGR